jgi:hypothetical protein
MRAHSQDDGLDAGERRVVALLERANAEVRAPAMLRARLQAARPKARVRRARAAAYATGIVAALAAVVLALALALPGGSPGSPTISEAAALAARGPVAAAPGPDRDHPDRQLSGNVQDVYFPNWRALGWRAVGQRLDHVRGRLALTVYYARSRARIAYTIVSAPALAQPAAIISVLGGISFRTLGLGRRIIVTWRRAGHTCVLSAPAGFDPATLRALAAWRAGRR